MQRLIALTGKGHVPRCDEGALHSLSLAKDVAVDQLTRIPLLIPRLLWYTAFESALTETYTRWSVNKR